MRQMNARKTGRRSSAKPAPRTIKATRSPGDRGIMLGARKKPKAGFVARALSWLREKLLPSRPMLVLTLGFLALTGIAALFVGGTVGRAIKGTTDAVNAVVADAGFGVANLDIAGNRRTSKDTILAVLNIGKDQTTPSYDIRAARARLLQLPWVATADVRRRYPDTLAVTLTEKHPFALWKNGDAISVIDRAGKVITTTDGLEFQHLPRFIGEEPVGAAELTAAIAARRAVHARVWAMQRMGGRRWNLILDDQVVVELPEEGWLKELDELEHLLVDTGVLERDIKEIDLRQRDNYYFVLRNGMQQPIPRGNAT